MSGSHSTAIAALLKSPEPSVRWKVRAGVLGENVQSKAMRALREEVRVSPRVQALLSRRDSGGRLRTKRGVYDKWQGAHWVLASLADLGYPEEDSGLFPVRDQVLDCWLNPEFYVEFEATGKKDCYGKPGVPMISGLPRRCASQQAYALYSVIKLGLANERVHDLTERLLHWQWPDGGWNCDKDPKATKSTFIHTIHSMRALHLYGRQFRKPAAMAAAKRASEIFLSRSLFKRRSNGAQMKAEFTKLHYPLYWHYDILSGLRVMAETGHLGDPRCGAALDLLEEKHLADGGWPAESRYYFVSDDIKLNADYVDWGGTSTKKMNPWVTADALSVLVSAGRLSA